jgi:hypothetical protein
MSLSSESISPRRHSLAWAMVVIAVIAALRTILPLGLSPLALDALYARLAPDFLNFGLGVMILVFQVGLFRLITLGGARRAFWLGFGGNRRLFGFRVLN